MKVEGENNVVPDLLGGEVGHESGAVLDQLWGVAEQSAHSNLEQNMVKLKPLARVKKKPPWL